MPVAVNDMFGSGSPGAASSMHVAADPTERRRRLRRLLIADDHAMLRLGLRAVLQTEPNGVEILEATCLQDALAMYQEHGPIDLVLLDLNMADCRGLQGLRRFKEAYPQVKIAVLSATQDEFVIRHAQALGASAYFVKSSQPAVMSEAVQDLLRGDIRVENSARSAFFPAAARSSNYDRVAELGARHLEILDLLLFGCSNQEISNSTGLSLGTVKNYVSTILLALDVKSRSHLISLFR